MQIWILTGRTIPLDGSPGNWVGATLPRMG